MSERRRLRGTTVGRWAVTAVVAVVSTIAVAGCSDVLTGGKVDLPSYGPVTPPPAPPPGSATLPAGFPTDIPVVRGRYRLEPGPVRDSLSLVVTEVPPGALENARCLLTSHGYRAEPVLGQQMYLGPRYIVAVSGQVAADRGYRLTYTVLETKSIKGLPELPQLTVPTLIPVPRTTPPAACPDEAT